MEDNILLRTHIIYYCNILTTSNEFQWNSLVTLMKISQDNKETESGDEINEKVNAKRVGDTFVWKHIKLFILLLGLIRFIICVYVSCTRIFLHSCCRFGGWSMMQKAHNKDHRLFFFFFSKSMCKCSSEFTDCIYLCI